MDVVSYLLGKNAGGGGTPSGGGKIQPIALEFRNYNGDKINANIVDTSRLTTMKSMFANCVNVEMLDLSGWNVSNATNAQFMFLYCSKLQEIKTGANWDTSRITNFSSMYSGCTLLKTIPYSSANSATNMSSMFDGCNSLTNESIDNILRICVSAVNYTKTKTLIALGINTAVYLPEMIVTLPHYQDFINAGWIIQ